MRLFIGYDLYAEQMEAAKESSRWLVQPVSTRSASFFRVGLIEAL